jgi:hypothetical protein
MMYNKLVTLAKFTEYKSKCKLEKHSKVSTQFCRARHDTNHTTLQSRVFLLCRSIKEWKEWTRNGFSLIMDRVNEDHRMIPI